jgi:hypothetical protein
MAEVKKEVKKYEITEEEINALLQFIGTKPLAEALQPFGILQGVLQKEIKPQPNRATRRKLEKTK